MAMTIPPTVTPTASEAAIKSGLSAGLGVDPADVLTVIVTVKGRRLRHTTRRLQATTYDIAYQVAIQAGTDPAELTAKASMLGAPGGAQDAFLGGFPDSITIDKDSPKVTQG
eukprot:gnl/TRDRNA2_/TRDRNA2_121642_c0_seq1.p2 gnl/TRDRNA2_/TRDRNA2_121642_c0~~gnl/TRDRNA2_/TRDRNA2_121642_c0_seq1.p2  ORF type:complete len:112 (-),score=20.16 gnl/TRDRNA2_/TRDRNA2_121642_c0_seq1:4-339(-)